MNHNSQAYELTPEEMEVVGGGVWVYVLAAIAIYDAVTDFSKGVVAGVKSEMPA